MQLGMSVHQTINAVFMILGPMIGTLVYYQFGINTAVIMMGACFLLSALALTFLPKDQNVQTTQTSKLSQEMKSGFRYVVSNRIFLFMGGFFLAAGLGMGLVNPLGIFLVTEHLGLAAKNLQWFTAVSGIGMFLGGMLAMVLSRKIAPRSMLLTGFIANAAAVAVLGSVKVVWIALLAQLVSGMMVPFIHIACNTLVLTTAEESFVGRVNGILNPMFMGGMVLNMSLVGVLKAQFSLGTLYFMAAGLFIIGAVAMMPMRRNKQNEKPLKIAQMHHH